MTYGFLLHEQYDHHLLSSAPEGPALPEHATTIQPRVFQDNTGHVSLKSCRSAALNPSFCTKSGCSITVEMLIAVGRLVRGV